MRYELAHNLTELLFDEGYPPEWDEIIFDKVLAQVENFKYNSPAIIRPYDSTNNDIPLMAAEP